MHYGEPKIWYSIPPQYYFEAKNIIDEHEKNNKMIHPNDFIKYGVPVHRYVQEAGQFVIIYSMSFFSTIDTGVNHY